MEWKTHLLLLKLKEKKMLSKEEPVSGDLEETAGCGVPSQRKKFFPKKEPYTVTLEKSGNRRVLKKKRNLSFQGGSTAVDPKEVAIAREGSKKTML